MGSHWAQHAERRWLRGTDETPEGLSRSHQRSTHLTRPNSATSSRSGRTDQVAAGVTPRIGTSRQVRLFREAGQAYPLMIFEVDSRATSSIAYNATKVFVLERPRFR